MQNDIVVHIGGLTARNLYSTIHTDVADCFEAKLISIETNAKWEEKKDNLLVTLGTPLPPITRIPDSFEDAINELSQYDGVFSFIFWDKVSEKIIVCTDPLGIQPLYWRKGDDGIIFSSQTKIFNTDYDPAGWGAFLSLGYALGNQTLTKGVERVPAACILIIDIPTQAVDCRNYWNLAAENRVVSLSDVYGALDDSMDKAISVAQFDQVLLMSGGFDSRLIACMLKQKKQLFKAIIISHYDENLDADAQFAKKMANELNIIYDFVIPNKNYFSSNAYLDYLFDSESEIPSLYLFISQAAQFIPHNTVSVWDGLLPGGTLKGRKGGFELFFSERGMGYDSKTWDAARTVFANGIAEKMWVAFKDTWEKEISRYSDDSDGTTKFFVEHRLRNRTGPNPFKIFQKKAQVFSPGMTRYYMDCAMSIPYEKKKDYKFYREIFLKYMPEALKIPLVHGNTIEHTNGFSLASRSLTLASAIHLFLKRRPRLMRCLFVDPGFRSFQPSCFLTIPSVMKEPDPVLNQNFLRKLQNGEKISPETKQLLFHWRVWRWLHGGVFNERFRANSAQMDK